VSGWLLRRFDYERVVRRRRENFEHLLEVLGGHVDLVFDRLADGVCPLFFPILVPERAHVAQQLRERGVPAGEWWPTGDGVAVGAGHEDAQYLRPHVLELPIHQDLTAMQVEFIANEVLRLYQRTARTGVVAKTPWESLAAASIDGPDK